jgi:L-fuconolactonase
MTETILDPDLAIVDPHHHLWPTAEAADDDSEDPLWSYINSGFSRKPTYLLEDLAADVSAGHDIRATVYMEAGSMYRQSGPEPFRSTGEVEFAVGVATNGAPGPTNICAGIVGFVDLRLTEADEVLAAHVQAGKGRYRGVRNESSSGLSTPVDDSYLLRDKRFREGFALLAPMGLSFDAFLRPHQVGALTELARAFPDTQIVLDHAGVAATATVNDESAFDAWRDAMSILSDCPNVAIKIGGLGGPDSHGETATMEQLAEIWRPYIVTSIELFGVDRCMFESDYPASAGVADYVTIWNVFKQVASGASASEKAALCSGTASQIYRIGL